MMSDANNKWSYITLSELGSLGRGKSKHRPRNDSILYGGKYPFIQTSDVKHANFYVNSYSQTYNETGLAQSKLWAKDTLCITIAANIAESALLSFPACFPDSIVGFVANPIKSDVRFIKYALDQAKKKFQKTAKGTAQDNLSLEKIDNLKLKIPSVSYQIQVASIISAYDELIGNNERRIKILEEMAQRLYIEWFVKFRFSEYEKVKMVDSGTEYGEIPEDWRINIIDDLYITSSGGTPNRARQNDFYKNGKIDWIKTKELNGRFVLESEERITELAIKNSSAKIFPKNTTLVAMYGATIGKLGISYKESATNQACCVFLLKNKLLSSFYIFQYLEKNLDELVNLGMGAAQPNLSQMVIRNLKIIRPTDDVLEKYNFLIEPIFNNILFLQKKMALLSKGRDFLMSQLVSGDRELKVL